VASVHPSIRRKLGQWRDSELTDIQVNYDSDGTSISMRYETKYADGSATEQFIWVTDGDKTLLQSDQIDSKDLILR